MKAPLSPPSLLSPHNSVSGQPRPANGRTADICRPCRPRTGTTCVASWLKRHWTQRSACLAFERSSQTTRIRDATMFAMTTRAFVQTCSDTVRSLQYRPPISSSSNQCRLYSSPSPPASKIALCRESTSSTHPLNYGLGCSFRIACSMPTRSSRFCADCTWTVEEIGAVKASPTGRDVTVSFFVSAMGAMVMLSCSSSE